MTDNLNNLTAVCSFLHSWLRLAGCGALDGDFWGTWAGLGWAEVGKGESWNRIWMLFCLLGLIRSHLISFHRDLFLRFPCFCMSTLVVFSLVGEWATNCLGRSRHVRVRARTF